MAKIKRYRYVIYTDARNEKEAADKLFETARNLESVEVKDVEVSVEVTMPRCDWQFV